MAEKSPPIGSTKLPDRIVQQLLLRIFTGDLKPGERLPPLRELALQMDVDRTSLRIAMERLNQLNLVTMIHGSGVLIRDFREHAGISFLRAVFSMPDRPAGEGNSALLLQMMEFMSLLVPGLIGLASHRATPMQIEQMISLYHQHLDHVDDIEKLVELRTATEDLLADIVGNLIVKLIYNSTRPLRMELNRRILANIDIPAHVEMNIRWLRQFLVGGLRREDVETMYVRMQSEMLARTRADLMGGQ